MLGRSALHSVCLIQGSSWNVLSLPGMHPVDSPGTPWLTSWRRSEEPREAQLSHGPLNTFCLCEWERGASRGGTVPSLLAAETVQLGLHCGLQPSLCGRDPQVLRGRGSVLLPGVLPSLGLGQLPPSGWEPPLQPGSLRSHQECPALVPGCSLRSALLPWPGPAESGRNSQENPAGLASFRPIPALIPVAGSLEKGIYPQLWAQGSSFLPPTT